jgi:predicted NBD/HSP70 family sugar kinase
LELAPDSGVVLVADLGVHGARLAVADLGQRLLAHETLSVQLSNGPENILAVVEERWRDLLSAAGCVPDRVRTIAVGLPGPVDRSTGTPVRPPLMPGWDAFPVGQELRERFNCDVLVNNDANLMALGEARALPPSQYPLVFIKVSTGIGCGIIGASGELHDGADGAAGDIGHIRVPNSDHVLCRCGNLGCLEAVASASAMIRALQDPTPDLSIPPGDFTDVELDALVKNIRQGDSQTIRLLREAAAVLGRHVASIVNVINPSRIVLGGAIAAASDDLLAGVRSGVYNRAMPLATRNLTLAHSVLGPVAGVVGGAVSAIEHVLSPEGLTHALMTGSTPHGSTSRHPRATAHNLSDRKLQPGARR